MKRLAFVLLALSGVEGVSCTAAAPSPEQDYRDALNEGDPARALVRLDRAIAASPRAEYYAFRARLRPEGALADYSSAIELRKGDPALHFSRGMLHARAGRVREADADFSEAIRAAPEHTEAYLRRARLRSGAAAQSDVAEARRVGAGQADGFFNEGVRALLQRQVDEAERMFEFALDLDPFHSRSYVAMARLYLERRQFAEAAAALDQAILARPKDAELYYHRGNARLASGRGEAAFEDYQKAVELAPAEAAYRAARGLAWHRVKGDVEKAKADFDEAIALDRRCHAAWLNRGVLRHERKDLAGAERDLLQAGTIRTSPEGCVALGRVLHDREDYDKALSLYRQAMELFKDPELQKSFREELERTRLAKEKK